MCGRRAECEGDLIDILEESNLHPAPQDRGSLVDIFLMGPIFDLAEQVGPGQEPWVEVSVWSQEIT